MELIIIIFLLLASFGFRYLRELEDRVLQGKDKNKSFLKKRPNEPNKAWYAKYDFPLQPFTSNWMYLWLIKPKYKERFPYSTTLFVFITDKEHTLQLIQLILLILVVFFSSLLVWYKSLLVFLSGIYLGQIFKEIKNLDK